MSAGELPDEVDALFAAPLSEFTERRNSLARQLKDAGRDSDAGAVKALRKPRVPAWTINQLARRRGDDVRELVEATEQLRAVESAERFRDLSARRHDLVDRLADAAPPVMEGAGLNASSAAMHEIAQTLRAATTDEQLETLRRGTLVESFKASGFVSAPSLEDTEEREPKVDPELERLKARLDDARDDVELKRKRADQAIRRAREAERDLEAAEQTLTQLQDRIDRKNDPKARR